MDIISFLLIIAILSILLILLRIYCAGGVNKNKRDLTDKIIVITGGTNGMGKIIVEQLADTKCKIISLSRNNQMAENVIQQLKKIHKEIQIEHIQCDLGNLNSIKNYWNSYHIIFSLIDLALSHQHKNHHKVSLQN